MAVTHKVLAQANPAATTLTTLYTCPASTEAIISTLAVCNQGGTPATFRVAISPDAAAINNAHYVVFDMTVEAKDTIPLTIGMTINSSDLVRVYASTTTLSFNLFGAEIV